MDQLAAIKVFVAVADAGSLSAAGRRLSMPLTTVSRHLAALEDLVGVRLITRTTRELALTETGRHYLESCRRILAELDAARLRVAGAQDEPQGELAITAPVAFGRLHVLPIVTAFLKSSPRVTARMLLIDRVVDLIEEGIDVSAADRDAAGFLSAGDAGRRHQARDLRKPLLSCGARRAIVAARACRA